MCVCVCVCVRWLGIVITKAENVSYEQSKTEDAVIVVQQAFAYHLLDTCSEEGKAVLEGTEGELVS